MADAYVRFAEADGACFVQDVTGRWIARDKDGITVVCGALSIAEAARLYCEDRDITPSTNDAIMARIFAAYRPYDTHPAFREGYRAYQLDGVFRRNPHDGVAAQAWERGASAAMLYRRALAHLDAVPADAAPETASPGWLSRLIRTGRC